MTGTRIKTLLLLVFIVSNSTFSISQNRIKLWKEIAAVDNNHAELLVFPAPADNNTGAAVIICPGGSYHHLGIPHEGIKTAKWFNSIGVNAFVLRYRVSMYGHHHPSMIQDFQRATQIVREHAEDYAIDITKVGCIGFSAGGHLVTMGAAFAKENYLKQLSINTITNVRPDWVAAIYPVVSMQDSIAHTKSRKNLLGKNQSQELKDRFSMEMQIPNDMPPTFLLASKDDPVVDVRNSIALDKALTNKNIEHKFLLFDTGGHGYGMKKTAFTTASQWQKILYQWLKAIKMIE